MAHDVRPPDAGPWQSAQPPALADTPMVGPWGVHQFNPYAPPSERADWAATARPLTPGELRLASPGQRLLAKTIDSALLGLSLAPGLLVQQLWDTELGVALWSLGLLAIGVFQWAITATSGQTLGKRWTGLRVVTEKGGQVGFFRGVFLRVWVWWVGSLLTFFAGLLLDPFFVFGKQRRTLHDHLAGTLVIVADTPGDPYS